MVHKNETPAAFKSYDIRGKYPDDISPAFAEKIGRAIGKIASRTKKDSKIIVCGDNNTTTPEIKSALIKGILMTGTGVTDIGIGPTDMAAFAGKKLSSQTKAGKGTPRIFASVMVTASHLGKDYNGFKFMYPEGNSFTNEDLAKIKEEYMGIIISKKAENTQKNSKISSDVQESRQSGHLTQDSTIYDEYISHAISIFKKVTGKDTITAKVIVDTGDGATSHTTPIILEKLGAEVIKINSDLDGGFRRPADCAEIGNISYLKGGIKRHNADIAIAHDLDGDRIAAFDRDGEWLTGDEMFAIFAKALTNNGGTIVASIDTSRLLEHTVQGKNTITYTRVGDPFVLKALTDDKKANLAGEPNGHYALREFIPYNSGTFFALILASISKDIPQIKKTLEKYYTETRKISVPDKPVTMEKIIFCVESNFRVISKIDGIKYEYKDGTVLIRPSGTEDTLRVVVESKTNAKKNMEEIIHRIEHIDD